VFNYGSSFDLWNRKSLQSTADEEAKGRWQDTPGMISTANLHDLGSEGLERLILNRLRLGRRVTLTSGDLNEDLVMRHCANLLQGEFGRFITTRFIHEAQEAGNALHSIDTESLVFFSSVKSLTAAESDFLTEAGKKCGYTSCVVSIHGSS
jgi:hypothetical protein